MVSVFIPDAFNPECSSNPVQFLHPDAHYGSWVLGKHRYLMRAGNIIHSHDVEKLEEATSLLVVGKIG